MTDIVRLLQNYATSKGWIFHYGQQAVLNLIDTGETFTGNNTDVYFLLEYRNIKPVKGSTKLSTTHIRYDGTFYLVKHSDLDQNFMNEVGSESIGKYVTNIEPLLQELVNINNYFACSTTDFEVQQADDVTDFIDMNADGLMVRFTALVQL